MNQNKIRHAWHKFEPHPGEFHFVVVPALIREFSRAAHVLFVLQARERACLGNAVRIEGLARFLQHFGDSRRSQSISDAQIRQTLDF